MEIDELLLERARLLSRVKSHIAVSSLRRAVVVAIGSQHFGFPIEQVVRVRPIGRCTPVPHAPAAIIGVAKLEGHVAAVFGGRTWRGLPEEVRAETPVVILGGRDGPLALLVDSVVDAIEVPERLPDLRRPGEPWLHGIIGDVLLVDVDRLIELLAPDRGIR